MFKVIVLVAFASAPNGLVEELRDPYLARCDRVVALSKAGRYADAAAALEKFAAEWKPDWKRRSTLDGMGEATASWIAEGRVVLARRKEWASEAATDFGSAQKLIMDLIDSARWVDRGSLADPRVQSLLADVRKLDPWTAALLKRRRVRVVIDGPTLNPNQRTAYAKGVAKALAGLGLVAAASATEEFRVTAFGAESTQPTDGGDVKECRLTATATFGELGPIYLETHGGGPPPNCLDDRLTESGGLAGIGLLRAWAFPSK